jgi:outer membrane protein, heavy metal efflux system
VRRFLQGALTAVAALAGLSGCARDHVAALPQRADLAASLASLRHTLPPRGARDPGRAIDISRPLTIDEIGLLAILNNPDLKSARGRLAVARAGLLQATLLPDPSASLGYGDLIAGPGTASSIAASLTEDIAALISRGARVDAAAARLGAVDAEQLWREWQVAQKARQLAIDLYWRGEAIRLVANERGLIAGGLAEVRRAVAAGNLTLAALAPLAGAAAAAGQSLGDLRLAELKDWQALDRLLGVVPRVRFPIARPSFPALPPDPQPLLADLPQRRPDLAALRLGYQSAEAAVRAAILGQFPAFSIGPAYASDTTQAQTLGPSFTLALPLFDRNRGRIATARATRLLLREQYQARLDAAVADGQALYAQLRRLSADLEPARQAASAAAALAATARRAYAQGDLDQRSLTDYATAALERAVQVTALERQIGEDRVFLAVELGLGLPRTRIALVGAAAR